MLKKLFGLPCGNGAAYAQVEWHTMAKINPPRIKKAILYILKWSLFFSVKNTKKICSKNHVNSWLFSWKIKTENYIHNTIYSSQIYLAEKLRKKPENAGLVASPISTCELSSKHSWKFFDRKHCERRGVVVGEHSVHDGGGGEVDGGVNGEEEATAKRNQRVIPNVFWSWKPELTPSSFCIFQNL